MAKFTHPLQPVSKVIDAPNIRYVLHRSSIGESKVYDWGCPGCGSGNFEYQHPDELKILTCSVCSEVIELDGRYDEEE